MPGVWCASPSAGKPASKPGVCPQVLSSEFPLTPASGAQGSGCDACDCLGYWAVSGLWPWSALGYVVVSFLLERARRITFFEFISYVLTFSFSKDLHADHFSFIFHSKNDVRTSFIFDDDDNDDDSPNDHGNNDEK